MTRDVCGEWDVEIDASADAFQFDVDEVCHVLILPPAVPSDVPDDGQDVGRGRRVIFVHDVLHRFFPLDRQQLVGLSPTVGQDAVVEVFLLEESHIDERHATGVE